MGGLWLQEVNVAAGEKRNKDHLKVIRKFIQNDSVDYLHAAQFLQIMLATAGNTSPVEV